MANFGSQSVLHWSGTGQELDNVVGGMAGLQSLNKEMGGQQLEVLLHRKNLGFTMQVVDGG